MPKYITYTDKIKNTIKKLNLLISDKQAIELHKIYNSFKNPQKPESTIKNCLKIFKIYILY